MKVLNLMLSKADTERIDPFFDILCTYLRSAMTHIDGRIQEDSLFFLDTLLVCIPTKVAHDFHKIIPNFLDMISKLRVDSKPGRTLTVNLGSQITSVKWRVKVLNRLKDYLMAYVIYNHIEGNTEPLNDTTQIFDSTKMNYFSFFNPVYTQTCHVSCFSAKALQDTTPIDEGQKFTEYVDTLMPLLFETWLEVCPKESSEKNMETVVSEDAALLLTHTLEVFALIWVIIKHFDKKDPNSNIKKQFSQKYRQPYQQHFINSFPYVTNVKSKQRSGNNSHFENNINDPKMVRQNLATCQLFILLNPYVNVKKDERVVLSVVNFIMKTFNSNTLDSVNSIIIRILQSIFSSEVNNWTRTLSVMEPLVNRIISAYFNKDVPSAFKQKIFGLLCKIAMNDNLVHFHNSDAFNNWLKNLPDILLEESITVQTIDIIHKFAVQNNKVFNTVIKQKLLKIVQNLPTIVVSDVDTNSRAYYKLFSLLFYVKHWDEESLNALEKQLLNNMYKNDYGTYIFDTLKLRSVGAN